MRRKRQNARRRHSYLLAFVSLIAAACLVVAVILTNGKRPWVADDGKSNPIVSLYVDGSFGPKFAGEMIADTKSYFRSNGVDARLFAGVASDDLISRVVHTRSIGVTTGQKFLLAAWRGEPIVAFGASFLDTPTAIFSLANSTIRSPNDLLGKRVGYSANSEDAIVYDAMMEHLKLPSSRIEKVSSSDALSALADSKVDAAVSNVTSVFLNSAGALNIIRPSDYGIHIPGLVYFSSANMVQDYPSIVSGVLRAVILGWKDVYEDMENTLPIIAGFDPAHLGPSEIKSALLRQRDLIRPVGTRIAEFDPSRWNALQQILLQAKAGEATVGLTSVVSYEILKDVYRRPLNSGADLLQGSTKK